MLGSDVLAIGSLFDGRFRITAVLGEGGLGVVYKARQEELNRDVAIKVLHSFLMQDADTLARFKREAHVLSQITDEHVVRVYGYGVVQETMPYLVLEYVAGKELASIIEKEHGLDWKRACTIVKQVCQGVAQAHQHGIIHRDLKPQNILIADSDGRAKVLDFGLSRVVNKDNSGQNTLTETGSLIGSVHYMSPEMCCGQKADERSDVYALGCILFQSITARPPFDADNPIGVLFKHQNEPVPHLSSVGAKAQYPEPLCRTIEKAMSKRPDERFQSMDEFGQVLSKLVEGQFGDLESLLGTLGKSSTKRLPSVMKGALTGAVFVFSAGVLYKSFHSQYNDLPAKSHATKTSASNRDPKYLQDISYLKKRAVELRARGDTEGCKSKIQDAVNTIGKLNVAQLSPSDIDTLASNIIDLAGLRATLPEDPTEQTLGVGLPYLRGRGTLRQDLELEEAAMRLNSHYNPARSFAQGIAYFIRALIDGDDKEHAQKFSELVRKYRKPLTREDGVHYDFWITIAEGLIDAANDQPKSAKRKLESAKEQYETLQLDNESFEIRNMFLLAQRVQDSKCDEMFNTIVNSCLGPATPSKVSKIFRHTTNNSLLGQARASEQTLASLDNLKAYCDRPQYKAKLDELIKQGQAKP